ncbi:MAG TPA: hypothetical protein PKA63_13510 [Oligoflexia bacterium]|nr:hypothetical protein [Oligoflexia bacterium]HMP49679.1 hypothetical protein [Oligoflexia bacterium]
MSWSRSQVPYSGDRARRVNPPIVGPQGQVCNVLRWHHFNNYNKISCISGSVTLDKNCNAVQPDQTRICGNADLRFRESTPISLMWTPKASPEAQISIVTFPLNPGVSGKWYAWKASASTPLLVFDPDHTGVIDSAKQLFGEWTFGGKTTAALMTTTSDVSNAPIGSPWKHGFEALASLDVNGDNKISGEELAPLALWFDENQDGISQPGEVKRLDDVGVVSLYYEVSFKDEVTGALYATRGYDRVVDGKVETLAAVDWMSEEAVVPHGLSMKYFLRNELSETLASDASDVTTLPDASDSDLGEKVSPSPFFGMWRWSYDDPNIEAASRGLPQGYLIFSPTQDGQSIEGMSLVHSRFLVGEKKDTPKSVINFFPLEGKAKSGEEMSFEVKHNNSSVLSSAKLENNGKTLRGESTVNQMVGRNNQRVTYRWVAERL